MVNPSASEANFRELESRDGFLDVYLDLIAFYLDAAFDDPAAAEVERWTLSCLPSTNGGARGFTLNIGPLEVMYADAPPTDGEDLDELCVSVYVSASELEDRVGLPAAMLTDEFPALGFHLSGAVSAGGDAVVVTVDLFDEASEEQFTRLIDDPILLRELADRLVQRGKGPYAQYHNRWFARAVLDRLRDRGEAVAADESDRDR